MTEEKKTENWIKAAFGALVLGAQLAAYLVWGVEGYVNASLAISGLGTS